MRLVVPTCCERLWAMLACIGWMLAGVLLMALVLLPIVSPEWLAALDAAGGAP